MSVIKVKVYFRSICNGDDTFLFRQLVFLVAVAFGLVETLPGVVRYAQPQLEHSLQGYHDSTGQGEHEEQNVDTESRGYDHHIDYYVSSLVIFFKNFK